MCMQVNRRFEEAFVPSVARVGLVCPSWPHPEMGVVELQNASIVLGPQNDLKSKEAMHDAMGCVEVYLQVFRGLPVRFRIQHELRQIYRPLPPRFQAALEQALAHHAAHIEQDATWELYGLRYGKLSEVADLVVEELNREIDAVELSRRLCAVIGHDVAMLPYPAVCLEARTTDILTHKEWRGPLASDDIAMIHHTFPMLAVCGEAEGKNWN